MAKRLLSDINQPTKVKNNRVAGPKPKAPHKPVVHVPTPISFVADAEELKLTEDSKTNIQKLFWIILTALVGLVLTILLVIYIVKQNHHFGVAKAEVKSASVLAKPAVDSVTSHLMFVGDVFWGRAIETAAKKSSNGPSNLFRGLTMADKQGYDAWIGDLECPVTDRDISYRTQVDSLVFNCRPEYTDATAKWFDVMTLANNHTNNNQGKTGLSDTRSNLEKAGIQYFGTFDMSDESDICEVVALKAHETNNLAHTFQIPVAMCGYDYVGAVTPLLSQMQQMQKYAKVMPVFAMPHMGVEYRATAEEVKVTTYRQLIDNGADVVIGAHPHVVQNTEVYNGHLIAYSVGNFLFDQQILGRDTTETLGVGVSITTADQQAIQAYKSIAEGCKAFKDDCLAQIQQKITKRPSFDVKYDFQCFDESSGTPVKASQQVCDQIKARATIDNLKGLSATL